VLLIHGARVPGVASFDLPIEQGSLAVDIAQAGHVVYLMDARGYGRSTRPNHMSEPAQAHPPLVRSDEVVRDIDAVVNWIRDHKRHSRVALLGWATGGHWAGYYASLHSQKLSSVVVWNTLYGKSDQHSALGRGSDMEDPQAPGRFNRKEFGAYRFNTAESLLRTWDKSIPGEDKSYWRDPAIASAYVQAALASDPTSSSRTPPSFRSPSGAMEDSFYLATGHQPWDASRIRVPVLIIRSAKDFWSRPEDLTQLAHDFVKAPEVKTLTIPGATHWVHLDRPERGRSILLEQLVKFLSASPKHLKKARAPQPAQADRI
jgi:pimeloyl-ACP methyl ester carboxylesterase